MFAIKALKFDVNLVGFFLVGICSHIGRENCSSFICDCYVIKEQAACNIYFSN